MGRYLTQDHTKKEKKNDNIPTQKPTTSWPLPLPFVRRHFDVCQVFHPCIITVVGFSCRSCFGAIGGDETCATVCAEPVSDIKAACARRNVQKLFELQVVSSVPL